MVSAARFAAFALAVCLPAAAAATEQLRRIQFWSMGTSTRIAFEFTGDFSYKSAKIENPNRIFFDIPNATFDLDGKSRGLYTLPIGDKLVKQIRVAPQSATVIRVVIDLEADAIFTASELKSPNRLMVEVSPPGNAPPPTEAPSVTASVGVTKDPPRAFIAPPASPRRPAKPGMDLAKLDLPPRLANPAVSRPFSRALNPAMPPAGMKPANVRAAAATTKPQTVSTASIFTPEAPKPVTPAPAPSIEAATPARANMGGDRSLTRALGLKLNRVVIDAGHGGHDDGTTGHGGLKEKDLVLDIALRTGKLVQERLGAEVIYTRETDTFIPLERRPQIANELHADVFLSVHANSSTIRSVTGVETYFLASSGTRAALEVASRENATANLSIADLESLVQKITLSEKIKESVEFASRMQLSLVTGTGIGPGGKARNRGVRKAPFIVLIGAKMPAILAEVGFLSNPAEEAAMNKSEYRDQIADALCKGLEAYAQSLSRFSVAGAQTKMPEPVVTEAPARVTAAPLRRTATTSTAARARR